AKSYSIRATVNLLRDEVAANNAKTLTFRNVHCSPFTAYPFLEDFEEALFPPPCWTVHNVGGGTTIWARNTDPYYSNSGTASAFHNFTGSMQESWLITPALKLANSGDMTLEFWSGHNGASFNQYTGIWISITDADPASFVELKQLRGSDLEDTLQKISVPLNAFAGQVIYIGFKYRGDYADGWYIDDVGVTVEGEPVSIQIPLESSTLTVYPNPVKDVLHIQTDEVITEIFVLDLHGRVVMHVRGHQTSLDLQPLAAGQYIIRIHTATEIRSVKVVKK
ncbi:MAG: choice-of-anchor J domain-containing protein, partial [Bacteroidales bacterium]|nr:choice-of-anchor J domain-containing protein [Bacteroidales bacterium]